METQKTQILEETTAVSTPVENTEVVAPPVPETPPAVAVAVEGVEVEVKDADGGGLDLNPATGAVVVLVVGLLAVAVSRLRKK